MTTFALTSSGSPMEQSQEKFVLEGKYLIPVEKLRFVS
jgi:hypothetical protein